MHVPLLPLESYILIQKEGELFYGAEIPLCFKSLVLAYTRALAVVGTLTALVFTILAFVVDDFFPAFTKIVCPVALGLAFVLAACLCCHGSLRNATYERAIELAEKIDDPTVAAWCRLLVQVHFHGKGVSDEKTTAENKPVPQVEKKNVSAPGTFYEGEEVDC